MLTLNERAELSYAQLGIPRRLLTEYVEVLKAFRTDLLAELAVRFEEAMQVNMEGRNVGMCGYDKSDLKTMYAAGAASVKAKAAELGKGFEEWFVWQKMSDEAGPVKVTEEGKWPASIGYVAGAASMRAQLDAAQANVARLTPFAVKIAGAEMPVGQGPRTIQIFGDFIEAARKAILPTTEPKEESHD